jgi:hypothetical protein
MADVKILDLTTTTLQDLDYVEIGRPSAPTSDLRAPLAPAASTTSTAATSGSLTPSATATVNVVFLTGDLVSNLTATLPAASGANKREFIFVRTGGGAFDVIVTPVGASSDRRARKGEMVWVISDGTTWQAVEQRRGPAQIRETAATVTLSFTVHSGRWTTLTSISNITVSIPDNLPTDSNFLIAVEPHIDNRNLSFAPSINTTIKATANPIVVPANQPYLIYVYISQNTTGTAAVAQVMDLTGGSDTSGGITTSQIADGAVTQAKIAAPGAGTPGQVLMDTGTGMEWRTVDAFDGVDDVNNYSSTPRQMTTFDKNRDIRLKTTVAGTHTLRFKHSNLLEDDFGQITKDTTTAGVIIQLIGDNTAGETVTMRYNRATIATNTPIELFGDCAWSYNASTRVVYLDGELAGDIDLYGQKLIGLVDEIPVLISGLTSGFSYFLTLYAFYPRTINSAVMRTNAGTCTVAVTIDGVNVTGMSAIAASITSGDTVVNSSGASTAAIGTSIWVNVSAVAGGALNLIGTIKTTRI